MSAAASHVDRRPAVPIHAGISNFRDFGGLPVAGGGAIVTGRLFRSAAPLGLDRECLASLGGRVSVVVDLRGTAERGPSPHEGFGEAGIAVVPVPVDTSTSVPLATLLAQPGTTARTTRDVMIAAYRAFVREHAETFGQALLAIAREPRPVLVHCTAGKDRTGFIVAVLQAALGADEASILRDYLETNTAWDRASVAGHVPPDHPAVGPVLAADPDYLHAAFEEIRARHGSPGGFIAHATGGRLSDDHLAPLIDRKDIR